MPNPNDPKRPNPEQPDPNDATRAGASSFEFQLPDEAGSFSDLPPIPDPDAAGGAPDAPPPPAKGGFEFGIAPGSRPSFGDFGMAPPPPEPPAPADDEFAFPDLPTLPGAGDSAVLFDAPLPPVEPSSATLHVEPLEPSTGLDDVIDPSALADIDLGTASGVDLSEPPKVSAGDSSAGFGSPLPLPDDDLPVAEPASSFTLGSGKAASGTVPDLAEFLPLPVPDAPAGDSSIDLDPVDDLPVAEPASSFTLAGPAGSSGSVPDVGSLASEAAAPVGSSGSTPSLPAVPPERPHTGASSFEFQLPDGAESVSDLPPIPDPDAGDFGPGAALPPKPVARPVGAASFDFINVGGGRSFADIGREGQAVDAGGPVAEATPAPPATDSKVGLGNLPAVDPVAPVSGWLDSVVLATPAEPLDAADALDLPVADLAESSDIFSGAPVPVAEAVGNSDVLDLAPAPEFEPPPAEAVRPSEVALTFDEPPGGSTVAGELSDLPVADEVWDDSGTRLGAAARDDESIHDATEAVSDDPLFDSANLADAPDLPAGRGHADAADYGAAPGYTADASSILGDLSGPHDSGADSSSVSVEAPGVDRTLAGGASDGMFDPTVADEPIPAELFEEPNDEWELDAVDVLADEHTADIDLGEPVDAELLSDTAPSNIFTDSPSARIGRPADTEAADEPTGDLTDALADDLSDDAAVEFSSSPNLGATVASGVLSFGSSSDTKLPDLDSADFDLPDMAPAARAADDTDDGGAIDWDAVELAGGDEATRGVPRDASLSAIIRGELPDDSDTRLTKDARPLASDDDSPVVTVDWMSGSAEEAVAAPADTFPVEPVARKGKPRAPRDARADAPAEKKTRPTKPRPVDDDSGTATTERPARPARKGGGMLVGLLVGGLVTGGALAGAYYGGVVPNGGKVAAVKPTEPAPGNPTPPPVAGTPAAVNPEAAFIAGDTAAALEHFKTTPPTTTAEKAAAGSIRVFATIQGMKDGEAPADTADLKAARADLRAVMNDDAARAEPGGVKRAVKAAVALGVSHEIAGDARAARAVYIEAMGKFPEYASTFEALVDKLDALAAAPAADDTSRRLAPADAERLLFALAVLLQGEPKGDEPEPGVYYWKAVTLAAANKYPEAVEQIDKAKAAHLARARAVAGRGLNPLSDPLEQIFTRTCTDLKAYWELRQTLYRNPAVAAGIKANGLAKTLDGMAEAEKNLPVFKRTLDSAQTALKETKAELTTTEEARVAAVLKADTTARELLRAEAEAKLAKAVADDTAKKLTDRNALVASLAAELKALPEKYTPADLLAAQKALAARATGPDLKALVPSGMVVIGGGGLATGQLLDIADRLTKAEATATAATAKLAADTKRLTAEYDADIAKLKDDQAEAVKTLKADSAEDLKKRADEYAAAVKKRADEYALATAKLKADSAEALADEQARTEAEKKKLLAREIEFEKQLANAVTPGQVMDIWLPVLTDLRRPADAAPALASAGKALAGSAPDSEDAAKARTVAGMAYLLRGEFANAREMFQAARRNPAYKAAAGKPWAVAVVNGLEALDDPAAPYRRPVVLPPVNLKAAAQSLDTGIYAYKAGRYDAAVAAFLDATKNNPADPVAWYFLGAARWAKGDEEQAKKDFAQGAEREKVSVEPARTLSAALAPIQGATRDAIDRTRP